MTDKEFDTCHLTMMKVFMKTVTSLKLIGIIGIAGLMGIMTACGRSMPKMDIAEQSGTADIDTNGGSLSDATQANDCSAARCDAIELGINALGMGGDNMLMGYVNDPVNWVLRGQDLGGSARKVGIYLSNPPPGATLTPAAGGRIENSVSISMQSASPQSSTVPLEIHLRDLERCEVTRNSDPACYQPSPLAEFDQTVSMNWQITYQGNTGPSGGGTDSNVYTPTTPAVDPCEGKKSSKIGKIIGYITNPIGSIVSAITGSDC